jgi:hypothetical protein
MSINRLCCVRSTHIVVLAIFAFTPSFCSGQALALVQGGVPHAATSNRDFGITLAIHRNAPTNIAGISGTCAMPGQTISPSVTARPSRNLNQPEYNRHTEQTYWPYRPCTPHGEELQRLPPSFVIRTAASPTQLAPKLHPPQPISAKLIESVWRSTKPTQGA